MKRTVAKFVEDDGDLFAVLFGEDVIEERRFAGTQVAGHNRYRNFG